MSQGGFERVAQKRRTRDALLAAAREMLAEGRPLGVAEVADRAGISRATAYRYFSEPQGMAEEAVLDAIAGEFERIDLGAAMAGTDAADRVAAVVAAVLAMVLRNEPLFRCYLGLVTGQDAEAKRGGRRIRWLREALAPIAEALPTAHFDRLINSLALVTGIETVIVLKDVCGLRDGEEIARAAQWIARSLVAASVDEVSAAAPPPSPG